LTLILLTLLTVFGSPAGYSLPLEGFLYRRPKGVYRLLTDFSVPFDDVYIDHLEVRVVLPEGAAKIAWQVRGWGVAQGPGRV
jgi:hypothetical protein